MSWKLGDGVQVMTGFVTDRHMVLRTTGTMRRRMGITRTHWLARGITEHGEAMMYSSVMHDDYCFRLTLHNI